MRGQQLAITAVVLFIVMLLMGSINGGNTAESMGMIVGTLILPLFNAHLFTKYIDSKAIKDNVQLSMIAIGVTSLFINSALIFIIIIGAMLVSHFTNKKKAKVK